MFHGSGANPALHPVGTGGSYPGGKDDQSISIWGQGFKKTWSYTSTTSVFMAWSLEKHRYNFTLLVSGGGGVQYDNVSMSFKIHSKGSR
jgi:hypothetical protein